MSEATSLPTKPQQHRVWSNYFLRLGLDQSHWLKLPLKLPIPIGVLCRGRPRSKRNRWGADPWPRIRPRRPRRPPSCSRDRGHSGSTVSEVESPTSHLSPDLPRFLSARMGKVSQSFYLEFVAARSEKFWTKTQQIVQTKWLWLHNINGMLLK